MEETEGREGGTEKEGAYLTLQRGVNLDTILVVCTERKLTNHIAAMTFITSQ